MTNGVRKGLIHAIADCKVCGKHWEDYRTTQKQAAAHASKTGHRVIAELAYVVEYGTRAERVERRRK